MSVSHVEGGRCLISVATLCYVSVIVMRLVDEVVCSVFGSKMDAYVGMIYMLT